MIYRQLLKVLGTMSEDEVYTMLQQERKGQRRQEFLLRLHQRYCTLRSKRERLELLREVRL